jgi:hypothetical protein
MKLYEIAEKHNTALLAMADIEGLDESVITDTLEALEGEFNDKALSVAGFFQNIEAEIKAMRDAEKRIAERRKFKESSVTRLKDYLQREMIRTGITKIECPQFVISLRNNPESVQIVDESLIPAEFKRISYEIDKVAIKKAGYCPGAEIVKKQSLVIK